MSLAPVRAVPFPSESKLRPLYKTAYFIDAFAVSLPNVSEQQQKHNAEALARALFSKWPAWFSLLMWIRDQAVSVFGVKRSTEIQAAAEKQGIDTISIFPVVSRAENEVVVGEKDSHLDFQTSILIRENNQRIAAGYNRDNSNNNNKDKGKEMVVTTVVHCHGLFGKAYIALIKPFHVMIIKYGLARMPSRIQMLDYKR